MSDLTARYHAMFHAESGGFDARGRQRRARPARGAMPRRLPGTAGGGAGSRSTGRPRRAIRTRPGRSRCRCEARVPSRRRMSPAWSPTSTAPTRRSSRSATRLRRSRPSAGTPRSAAGSATPSPAGSLGRGGSQAAHRGGSASLRRRTGARSTSTASRRCRQVREIVGPAIVELSFTSIVIDPGATAIRDDLGKPRHRRRSIGAGHGERTGSNIDGIRMAVLTAASTASPGRWRTRSSAPAARASSPSRMTSPASC